MHTHSFSSSVSLDIFLFLINDKLNFSKVESISSFDKNELSFIESITVKSGFRKLFSEMNPILVLI